MTKLKVVAGNEPVFEYPYDAEYKISGQWFMMWEHNQYLESRLYRLGSREVRALALELFMHAQNQTPIGTLPDDLEEIRFILRVSEQEWADLAVRTISPLYKWEKCVTMDGEPRLYHPFVLKALNRADEYKRERDERKTKSREHIARERLPGMMKKAGATQRMLADDNLIDYVDKWLTDNVPEGKRRTSEWVRGALEAHATKEL